MIDPQAQQSYLEAQVLTATPQKLRLMLVDGAIAAARQAITLREKEDHERALEALIRCREIIAELLAGVRPDSDELAQKVTSVYTFLFRLITDAQLCRDTDALHKAVDILAVEQETWRMVCEKMPDHPIPEPNSEEQFQEITAAEAARILSERGDEKDGAPRSQLNLDA